MNIARSLRTWGAYRQTVRELSALDNRSLGDLGIVRSDIARIAREHAKTI